MRQISPIIRAHVVPRGGKLFVSGGCLTTSRHVSCEEIYDKSTNEWTYLPPLAPHFMPPTGTRQIFSFAVAITIGRGESKQIVVGGQGRMLCTYMTSTQTWPYPHFDPGLMSDLSPTSLPLAIPCIPSSSLVLLMLIVAFFFSLCTTFACGLVNFLADYLGLATLGLCMPF